MGGNIKTLRPYQQDAFDKIRIRLKETTDPLLVNASVGAGKTMIISALLRVIEKANWRALCLTMNSNLIEQNAESYIEQGGTCGIFCTGLGERDQDSNIIFASPHSIIQGIKKENKIKDARFNLIIVDECHNINNNDKGSMYIRILKHYGMSAQSEKYSFRVIGLTGTPYRGKTVSIIGPKEYFHEETVSISMPWLIDNGYLVCPIFGKTNVDSFDMSSIRVDNSGKFKHKDLQDAIDRKERLTGEIMREIVQVVEGGRNGAFIFASTIKHAYECMRSLPSEQSAIITAKTKAKDRKHILSQARAGKIKYLVNVATLLVGIDVPNYDLCAWCRPTESLTLFIQGIGRVLRLSPGKTDAMILDYAQNLDRHGDIDNPIINKAVATREEEKEYVIPCFECGTKNTIHARRCIGQIKKVSQPVTNATNVTEPEEYVRCSFFFEFKECPSCLIENDVTARECRNCRYELINPNDKLKRLSDGYIFDVIEAKYWVSIQQSTLKPIVNVQYITNKGNVFEAYYVNSEKAKYVFYGKFVKKHVEESSAYYNDLMDVNRVRHMIYDNPLKTPIQIICNKDMYGRFSVQKKIFSDSVS